MGLFQNNINVGENFRSFKGGIKSTLENTNISSVLMTAASMYFNQKSKVEWYFSPATNVSSITTQMKYDTVALNANNPLTSDSVLPMAYFIDMNIRQSGQAVGAPIEEGSFTIYNKTTEPIEMNATVAFDENKGAYHSINWQGANTKIQRHLKSPTINEVLNKLNTLKREPITFNIITPYYEYVDYTLETYEYSWKRESGKGVLFVNMKLKQIPQVKVVSYTVTDVVSPSCATAQKTGQVQGKKTRRSFAKEYDIF